MFTSGCVIAAPASNTDYFTTLYTHGNNPPKAARIHSYSRYISQISGATFSFGHIPVQFAGLFGASFVRYSCLLIGLPSRVYCKMFTMRGIFMINVAYPYLLYCIATSGRIVARHQCPAEYHRCLRNQTERRADQHESRLLKTAELFAA